MPKVGKQTWAFTTNPRVIATGTVGGKLESEGPLGQYFDIHHSDDRIGQSSWEHAEQTLFTEAADVTMQKAGVGNVDLLIGGDLNAQLSSYYFGLKHIAAPSLGVYSACASIAEALAIGAMAVDGGFAQHVLAGTSSHNSAAERQFRYPTEYGSQKPPTAQRTVTGAGAAILGPSGSNISLTYATVGIVEDYGIKNAWEYGAAMAPAADTTIAACLQDTGLQIGDFDCIATGDLGGMGHAIVLELLEHRGYQVKDVLTDCGMLIYNKSQPEVFSGGSGAACSSLVTFGYLLSQLRTGKWRRMMLAATGALLSAVTSQQQEVIPAVSHAVVFERRED